MSLGIWKWQQAAAKRQLAAATGNFSPSCYVICRKQINFEAVSQNRRFVDEQHRTGPIGRTGWQYCPKSIQGCRTRSRLGRRALSNKPIYLLYHTTHYNLNYMFL